MFPDNEVRKVIDNFTYFDYNQKAIFVGGNKKAIKRKVNDRVEAMYFIGDEITITIERKKLMKSFRYFFDAEYQFSQKNKNLWGSDNPICNLEIRTQFAEKRIYLDEVLRKSFRIKVSGHYVFYVNQGNKLIKVDAFVHPCAKSIMYSGKNPFIYEVNKNGDCCICSINSAGYLEVNINGQIHKQLSGQFPRTIMYDDVKKSWCIITKKSKENGYETYVINNTGMVSKEFGKFSFGGINLKNCIFYNGMIVVPAKKRIMFLKSGTTVAESTVAQLNIGVVDKDSEISIEEDTKSDRTYLFIKNNTQVYKIPLNKV